MRKFRMQFDRNGNLKGGIRTGFNLNDIERELVNAFPQSQSRLEIYRELTSFLGELDFDLVTRVWLDGSFCTRKENPNDIDILVFLKPTQATPTYKDECDKMETVWIDKYTITDKDCTDPQSPAYLIQSRNEKYWMGQFGFDRNRHHKAIIELSRKELK